MKITPCFLAALLIPCLSFAQTETPLPEPHKEHHALSEEELSARADALSSLQSALVVKLEAFDAEKQAFDKRVQALEARNRILDEREIELRNQKERLQQTSVALEKSRKDIEKAMNVIREKQNLLNKEMASYRQKSEAQSAERDLLTQDAAASAKKLFALFVSSDALKALHQSLSADIKTATANTAFGPVIQTKLGDLGHNYDVLIQKALDASALEAQFVSYLTATFNAQEIADIVLFYTSPAGKKFSAAAKGMDHNLQESTLAKAQSLLAEFRTQVEKTTSKDSLDVQIRQNLMMIINAGREFLKQKQVREVRFADLLASGFVLPIRPIDGEDYTTIVIRSTGGAVTVSASDERQVFVTYDGLKR